MPQMKKFFIATALSLLLLGCQETGTSESGPSNVSFDTPITLEIQKPVTFDDGLVVNLISIDDSRCKEGVRCIWPGQITATLEAFDGTILIDSFQLGTVQGKIDYIPIVASIPPYKFTLSDSTTTAATIIVTKNF